MLQHKLTAAELRSLINKNCHVIAEMRQAPPIKDIYCLRIENVSAAQRTDYEARAPWKIHVKLDQKDSCDKTKNVAVNNERTRQKLLGMMSDSADMTPLLQ